MYRTLPGELNMISQVQFSGEYAFFIRHFADPSKNFNLETSDASQ
jgi:hypothetical protein